jgi:hypothetical protein
VGHLPEAPKPGVRVTNALFDSVIDSNDGSKGETEMEFDS